MKSHLSFHFNSQITSQATKLFIIIILATHHYYTEYLCVFKNSYMGNKTIYLDYYLLHTMCYIKKMSSLTLHFFKIKKFAKILETLHFVVDCPQRCVNICGRESAARRYKQENFRYRRRRQLKNLRTICEMSHRNICTWPFQGKRQLH